MDLMMSTPAPVIKAPENGLGDMMDIFGGAPAATIPNTGNSGGAGGDLLDLLGGIDLGG